MTNSPHIVFDLKTRTPGGASPSPAVLCLINFLLPQLSGKVGGKEIKEQAKKDKPSGFMAQHLCRIFIRNQRIIVIAHLEDHIFMRMDQETQALPGRDRLDLLSLLRRHPIRKEVQKMDQMKIGAYLKDLRKEKNLTQEQIAEKFGVSQRSVSRWENGYTMPDISILIELADYYDVDLREILNGERKANNMDADLKETLVMVADYTNEEKKKLVGSLYSMIWTCIVAFGILIFINVFHLTRESTTWDTTAMFCSAIGLIYAISCFVRVLQLTGKIDKKSHSKVIIASLIMSGALFVLTIVAVLYGCGIIG